MTTADLSMESLERLSVLDIKMGHAMLFLNDIVDQDIQVPPTALEQAIEAKQALTQYAAQFTTIQQRASTAEDPAGYLSQPTIAHLLGQMDSLATVILNEQNLLLEAAENGDIDIVSRDELESTRGASMGMS